MTIFGNAYLFRVCGHVLSAYRCTADRVQWWLTAYYGDSVRRRDLFIKAAIERAFADDSRQPTYDWFRGVDLLDVVLAHVREHAVDMASALERARGLEAALGHACECVRTLFSSYEAVGMPGGGVDDAVSALNTALLDAREYAYGLGLFGTAADLRQAHDFLHGAAVEEIAVTLDRDIAQLADQAAAVAVALHRALSGEESEAESAFAARAVAPNTTARWLVNSATWVLPASHRQRKGEEFAAELYDVAALGHSARRQVAYALWLLVLSVPLRRSLTGVAEEERQR